MKRIYQHLEIQEFFVFFGMIAILAAVSCSKESGSTAVEEPSTYDNPEVSGVKTVISAQVPVSKTSVNSTTGEYFWNNGDAINIFCTDGTSCGKFTTEIATPASSADFVGNVSSGHTPKYALYPYDSGASCTDVGVISTVIPTAQEGTIASALSYAVSSDGKNFSFHNAVSVITLTFNASDRIKKVVAEFGANVAGNVSLDCNTGAISGATSKTVTVSSDTYFNGTVYLTFAPTDQKSIKLTFTNIYDETASKSTNVKDVFAVNSVKPLGTVKGLYFSSSAITDLSKNGTANCYIVPDASKKYKFKATVKGNSTTAIAPKSVVHLWSTVNTSTAPDSDVQIIKNLELRPDGYVQFETTSTAGNVIVAAKNASGTILWSWHLWRCSGITDVKHDKSASGNTMNGQTMLDRNLGALSNAWSDGNTKDRGFFYQWGRKDPFVGSAKRQPKDGATANGLMVAVNGTAKTITKTQRTVDWTVQNPTVFIAGNQDWLSSTNNNLWQEKKTMYDPCPVGYFVPNSNNGPFGHFSTLSSWTHEMGRSFVNKAGTTVWFPACGYLSYDTGTFNNDSRPAVIGRYWFFYNDANTTAYKWEETSGSVSLSTCYRATGCVIRCQKQL